MPPDEIGQIVFDALRADRFWIFTHEMHADSVKQRAQSIIDGTDPTYDSGFEQEGF
jgi:hypothetical protein